MKREFLRNGFAKLDDLLPFSEVEKIRILYNELLNDKQRTEGFRSDLGGEGGPNQEVEKITQIMRPSRIEPKLSGSLTYKLVLDHAKKMLGDDGPSPSSKNYAIQSCRMKQLS